MTKEEIDLLADRIRNAIKSLRKQGYTYKVFYEAINYSPMN